VQIGNRNDSQHREERFTAYGNREYLTLGRPEDGWTLLRAERELAAVLREVELGTWQPSRRHPPQPQKDPRFLEFASDWFALKRFEIEPNTARSYRNDLTNHLLPFFAITGSRRSPSPRSTATASTRSEKKLSARPRSMPAVR
jgi:hypothetical protein